MSPSACSNCESLQGRGRLKQVDFSHPSPERLKYDSYGDKPTKRNEKKFSAQKKINSGTEVLELQSDSIMANEIIVLATIQSDFRSKCLFNGTSINSFPIHLICLAILLLFKSPHQAVKENKE